MGMWSKHAYYSDYVDKPSWLYRLYDTEGRLLYVGISLRPDTRVMVHRSRQPWGKQIATYTAAEYPNREAAKAAERWAIHHQNPIHNLARPRMECC